MNKRLIHSLIAVSCLLLITAALILALHTQPVFDPEQTEFLNNAISSNHDFQFRINAVSRQNKKISYEIQNTSDQHITCMYKAFLQMKQGNEWQSLKMKGDSESPPLSRILPGQLHVSWFHWEPVYGKLWPGEYRLVTMISPDQGEPIYIAAEFEIK